MQRKSLWELRLYTHNALGDVIVHTALYSLERIGLVAFQGWLDVELKKTDEPGVSPEEKILTRAELEIHAKRLFDHSEMTCGPYEWDLVEKKIDETFLDSD